MYNSKYKKKYYQKNKEKTLQYEKERYQKKKQEIKKRMQKYRRENPEEIKKQSIIYYQKNKERIKEYQKKYRDSHKEKISKKDGKYYKNNSNKIIQRTKKYYNKNKNELIKKQVKRCNKRRKIDKEYAISERLRSLLTIALKKYTKTGKIMCSKKYGINFKEIILSLRPFPKDISKYHIDHIKPLCSFNFINEDGSTNLEEIKKAFLPQNHQWLLIKDNLSKGGRWDGTKNG